MRLFDRILRIKKEKVVSESDKIRKETIFPITAPDMEIDGNNVLKKYTGEDEVVIIPEGIIKIGVWAFKSNEYIRRVLLPHTVLEIDDGAFERSSIEEIVIPGSVRKMGYAVFQYCKMLRRVVLPDELEEIKFSTFQGCCDLNDIVLPAHLKKVGDSAFSGSAITELRLPEGMTYVGEKSFCGMAFLEKLYLPDTLRVIGEHAFEGCKKLTEIQFPEELWRIGNRAFLYCKSLERVDLPDSLVVLDKWAFQGTKAENDERINALYEKVNTVISYEKPQDYQEMKYQGMRFYYHTENVEYKASDSSDKPKEYQLIFDHEISDSCSIYKEKNGNKVLMIYVSVPTFDSGDREWDSYRKLFLIPSGGRLKGRLVVGGYHVARILIYDDIVCGDSRTEKIIKCTGII